MEYILKAVEDDEVIVQISSYSLEGLEEQWHKIQSAVREFEEKKEYEQTHSICCDAEMFNEVCAECKEPTGSQRQWDKEHLKV